MTSATKLPLVSIVIPAYNVASVIGETLASVLKQTYANFQVVIAVDEGSSDQTGDVVSYWCSKDPRFNRVCHPHCGISESRNIAIAHSHGEFIAFLDSDDVWCSNKLARQMDCFNDYPDINFCFTNYFIWDGENCLGIRYKDNKKLPDGNILNDLIFSCLFATSTIIVRREMLQRSGGFDSQIVSCEDWDLWLRLAKHGLNVKGIREPLMKYRRWGGNHSNVRLRTSQYEIKVLEKNQKEFYGHRSQKLFHQSLNLFRMKFELACAKQRLDSQPEQVPDAVWRAWRQNPRNFRWLLRWLMLVWPRALGGKFTAAAVHRKLRDKF